MKFRIKYAHQIVSLFILLALASIIFIVCLMAKSQGWLDHNYSFTTEFDTGSGLKAGTAINLSGFKIGQIESISLTEANKTKVEFSIYEQYIDKIKPNSVIRYVTSPIGLGNEIVFYPGLNNEPHLPEGSFIPSYTMLEAKAIVAQGQVAVPPGADTITNLINEVEPLMQKIDGLVEILTLTVDYLYNSLRGQGDEDLGAIISDLNSISEWLNSTISSAATEDMIETLNDSSKQLLEITQKINGLIPQLDSLLTECESTIMETGKVMEGVSNNPLIRNGISKNKNLSTTTYIRPEE
ncbi:MAG: MlaD family protein [Spirochaetia bacterium]|nr:MlaD family protein [Spirochaetia bacterium]